MRKLLIVLALTTGSLVALGGTASANECASYGPDLSRYGIQHVEYCGPSPI